MKKLVLLSLTCLLWTAGCARHYVLTLNNGTQIDTKGKPKRQGASYVYKDENGNERRISAGSVSEISPASLKGDSNEKFRFNPSK
jgi:hypothetical protein